MILYTEYIYTRFESGNSCAIICPRTSSKSSACCCEAPRYYISVKQLLVEAKHKFWFGRIALNEKSDKTLTGLGRSLTSIGFSTYKFFIASKAFPYAGKSWLADLINCCLNIILSHNTASQYSNAQPNFLLHEPFLFNSQS